MESEVFLCLNLRPRCMVPINSSVWYLWGRCQRAGDLVQDDDWHLCANWACPHLFVAHALKPSFILITVKHHSISKVRPWTGQTICSTFLSYAARPCDLCSLVTCCLFLFIHPRPATRVIPLQFLPCPCAPSIQRSHPFHLLPWWLMLATVRPSGWSALADSSPRLMEDASVQINVGRPTDAGISSQLAWPQFLGLNGYWFGSCILIICVGPCSITGVAA